jgi:hypothetical protein
VPSKIVGFIALLLTNYYAAALAAECVGGNVDMDRRSLIRVQLLAGRKGLKTGYVKIDRKFYANSF